VNVPHLALGPDLRAPFLGKIQVVLHQRVLGIIAAAHHAPAAVVAGPARRTFPIEIGIGVFLSLFTRLAKERPDGGWAEGQIGFQLGGNFLQHLIGRPFAGVGGYTEHAAGGVVVRQQDILPVGQVFPGGVIEQLIRGLHQDIGIPQASATHAGAVQNKDILEWADLQNAKTAQRR
jgi:hypothetical protein